MFLCGRICGMSKDDAKRAFLSLLEAAKRDLKRLKKAMIKSWINRRYWEGGNKMNAKIDMSRKYKTRDGRDVRILCVDGPYNNYPVVGIISGNCKTLEWHHSGKYDVDGKLPHDHDLIEVRPKVKVDFWINVYPGGWIGDIIHLSYDGATQGDPLHARIACIHIEREVEEGEGL
jgi:hypothetical protein